MRGEITLVPMRVGSAGPCKVTPAQRSAENKESQKP